MVLIEIQKGHISNKQLMIFYLYHLDNLIKGLINYKHSNEGVKFYIMHKNINHCIWNYRECIVQVVYKLINFDSLTWN